LPNKQTTKILDLELILDLGDDDDDLVLLDDDEAEVLEVDLVDLGAEVLVDDERVVHDRELSNITSLLYYTYHE